MKKDILKLCILLSLGYFASKSFVDMLKVSANLYHIQKTIAQSKQLILVVTDNWSSPRGRMQRFEKDEKECWIPIANTIPIAVGRTGLGWGIGQYTIPTKLNSENVKKEGDGKSPAGIFCIGAIFIRDTYLENHPELKPYVADDTKKMKISYTITKSIKAVDDPNSSYYNQVVDEKEVEKEGKKIDWNSAENMHTIIPLYHMGAVVNHNLPAQKPQAGSCIFIHGWQSAQSPTAGGTAMSEENIKEVFTWLDDNKDPLLVQLPQEVYTELKEKWILPDIAG